MQVNPYLFFEGNCEEAFKFYERVLDGKIEATHTYSGMPDKSQVPPGWGEKIMHVRMKVNGQELMGADAPSGRYKKPEGFSLSITLTDIVEAERVFRALAENGKVGMEFQQTFWAERFGMLVDQFGVPWMVNCDKAA